MKTFRDFFFLNESKNPHDGFRSLPSRTTLVKLLNHLEKTDATVLNIWVHWTNVDESKSKPVSRLATLRTSDYGYNKGTPWSGDFVGSPGFMSTTNLITHLTSDKVKPLIENDFPSEVRVAYDYDNKPNSKTVKITSLE